jgi:PAS domain S-box-containing protein
MIVSRPPADEGVLRDLPCGYLLTELDGTIRYANPGFGSCVGEVAGEIAGRRLQEFLAPGGNIFYEMQFAPTLILRGSLQEISFELVSANGKRVPVLVNATLTKDENGRQDAIAIVVYEIAQRKLYENELLRAQREFERVAEVVRRSSDAILRLSAEGVVESWNYGAQQIFGYSSSEAIGKDIFELLFAGQEQREQSLDRLKRGESVERELRARANAGKGVEVSMYLTPHMEAPGVLVAFSAVIRDITARKRAERALLQSEKLASVGRLASSIAHEINNPLEALTNLVYILRERATDAESAELLRAAEEELARVSQIARHTLRFYRQSSKRTNVNLCSVFEAIVSLYRARFKAAGITAKIECDESLELRCFDGELRQILVHLVSNAFDAMREGGQLRLRARRKAGTKDVIRILVGDTGTGISREAKAHLFEPFQSTKGIMGAGLGLWIARDLTVNNGGTIRVRSSERPENHGTVAVLTFQS